MTTLASPPISVSPRPAIAPAALPTIPFADPDTGQPLQARDGALINPVTGRLVAAFFKAGQTPIPRFVERGGGYAATFGWQWKRWNDTFSDAANQCSHKRNLILERTFFNEYDLAGKTLLECGCGSGNDTEVLSQLGLSEIHAFDLSASVEEAAPLAARLAADPNSTHLVLAQADIMHIPYPDRSFDVVYCHRVLQHTPDPAAAIRAICRKVKPGGILFAHCYLDSPFMRRNYRHKLRWLGRRLPPSVVVAGLNVVAPLLHRINNRLRARAAKGGKWGLRCQNFSHAWIPLTYTGNMWEHLGKTKVLDIEKCITFDAITAWHDHPMTQEVFRAVIESEGFTIDHIPTGPEAACICTARLTRPPAR